VSRLVLCGGYARGREVRAAGADEQRAAALDLELARVGWGRDDPAFRQARQLQQAPPLQFGTWKSTTNGVPVVAIIVNGGTRLN
jgi:hypothetical protein